MKKKVLFIVNDLGFFVSHRLALADELKHKGFDIIIGYGELGRANLILFDQKEFKTVFIPMNRGGINFFKEIKSIYFFFYHIKKIKPDLVHLVTIKPYLYGGIASRLNNVPCLVSAISGLGSLFIQNNLKNKLLKLFIYFFYKFAFNHSNQKIIVQNSDDAKFLVDWGVINSKKIILIKGSGVNLKNFKCLEEKDGPPVICFAARLLKDKGINEFIDAAEIIKKKGISCFFLIAGDLDYQNPSAISARKLNRIKKKNYFRILGYVKDIPKLYAKSNIICLPSYREGLPKSLVEAAAASRAIVTTDAPGCRDAVIPNKTGLLVPIKDSQKLADALLWLIEHPRERIKMGKAGRRLAEQEFAIEKIVKKHFQIYEELLNNIK